MHDAQAERWGLITGANRGIGRATAQQLIARGWRIVLGVRDVAAGQIVAQQIAAASGQVFVLPLDVSQSSSVGAAAQQLARLTPRLDLLINNAGIYPDEGLDIATIPREQLVETFHTNTFGPLEVVQAFLPYLRQGHQARIVNVSSGYGQLEGLSPSVPSYCLSKLALNGLTIMLATRLASDRIAVNSVCPGWVRTDMGGPTAPRSVEEGADTLVWLADEAPHHHTGKFFRDRQEIPW